MVSSLTDTNALVTLEALEHAVVYDLAIANLQPRLHVPRVSSARNC